MPQTLETALQTVANAWPGSLLPQDLPAPLPTGNPRVDQEHQWLHDLLRQAFDLCSCHAASCENCGGERRRQCMGGAIDLIGSILKSMVDHFRDEEAMFRREPTYGSLELHLREHAEITRWMGQLVEDYGDENTARCMTRLIYILHHWLQHHIVDYDQPFFVAFPDWTSAGASPAPDTAS